MQAGDTHTEVPGGRERKHPSIRPSGKPCPSRRLVGQRTAAPHGAQPKQPDPDPTSWWPLLCSERAGRGGNALSDSEDTGMAPTSHLCSWCSTDNTHHHRHPTTPTICLRVFLAGDGILTRPPMSWPAWANPSSLCLGSETIRTVSPSQLPGCG